MVKSIIDDPLFVINKPSFEIAKFLNQAYASTFTHTDKAFIQRTVNMGAHFAKAFIAQKPDDFMIWASAWGDTMDFLSTRFKIKDPHG